MTIKEIFPKVNGIFTHIDFDFGVNKSLLDVMWLGRYGKKNPSPEVEVVQDDTREVLTDAQLTLIGQMILALYSNKWTKLKAIPELDYDPIHNYLDKWEDHSEGWDKKDDTMTSQRTDTFGKSVSENRTDTFGKTVATNGTRTDNLLETETINETEQGSDSQADNLFGFNSTTPVGSDTSSGSNSKANTGTNSVANTGTQQNVQNVTEGGTEGRVDTQTESGTQGRSETNTDNYSGSDSRSRNGEHTGNIGNLTSQKMIGEEIELWKWNFINMVLEDVRDFCTLPIYRR